MQCKNKYWIENLPDLFCSFSILPLVGMDLEDQFNSLTRVVIIVFIILLLINIKFAVTFLIISLIILTIFYYFYKNKMKVKENYCAAKSVDTSTNNLNFSTRPVSCMTSAAKVQFNKKMELPPTKYASGRETSQRFCNDGYPTGQNQQYISINQKLAGTPNPRIWIPPVIAPKSHDLDYWRANNLVTHSHINAESFIDTYQSGYTVSNCCNYMQDKIMKGDNTIEYKPQLVTHGELIDNENGNDIKENFTNDENCISDNYSYPYRKTSDEKSSCLAPLKTGQINIACGYNPDNVNVNLPTNAIAGMCERDPKLSKYNKNLYTQTIQPGVYSRSQIMQPINSNIGISFQQQFQPVTCKSDDNSLEYTLHDPRLVIPKHGEPISTCGAKNSCGVRVTNSNIFDPRDHGYGTSYRSYIDELTGQPRYMYDDINAVRRPGYIVRSNIDFDPRMDHYGTVKCKNGLGYTKAIANDMFLRNSIKQRNSLMERYVEKQNTILAQRRKAPIMTSTSTGHSRCKS